jgi:drug/metabolite transporter (DMT)-like permease
MRPEAEGGAPLPYLAILLSTLCYAAVSAMTRAMSEEDEAELTSAATYGVMVAASGAAALALGHAPIEAADLPLFLGLGAAGALGMFAYAKAYVFAGVAALAPWDNMVFPWALLLGLVVFAEMPDGFALLGGALIMASGLLVSWLR